MIHKNAFDLTGHVALVTGSVRGIGHELSLAVAAMGADVAIVDLRQDACDKVAAKITQEFGVRTVGIRCDIRNSSEVEAMFDECERTLGLPDRLLNNAGVTLVKDSLEVTDEEWQNVFSVNATGTFYCCRALAKRLIAKKQTGSIVNLVSISHKVAVSNPEMECAYNASKAANRMMTKTLALEWIPYGIRLNSISPGFMMTDMLKDADPAMLEQWASGIPAGRIGTPDDLAAALIYLFSDSSLYTVGSDLVIDGGYTCQ